MWQAWWSPLMLQLCFQTISSPLVIGLLIDPASFLGSPLFLHLRKPKHMVVKSCWVSFDQGHLVLDSLPIALCQAQLQRPFHSSGLNSPIFLLISLFLSWIQRYYFFFRPCLCIKGKQSYSSEIIFFTDLYIQLCLLTAQNFCFLKKNYIGNYLLEIMQLKKLIYLFIWYI